MLEALLALSLAAFNSYHIGNSLTNDGLGNNSGNVQTGTYGLEAMGDLYGYDYSLSMHIDTSQGLTSIWDNPAGVDVKRTPYGDFTNALTNYQWDAVVLEPYRKPSETLGTDKAAITNFINLTHSNPANANTIFYIYQVWPQQSYGNYTTYWNSASPNVDSTLVRPMRQYYDNLMAWARDTYNANGTIIREVPTGEVWNRINLAIEAGEITGITMADLYRDDLHASGPLGRYVAAATVFATLFQQDVNGMVPPPAQFGTIFPQSLYDQFNRIIWQVVTSDPDTGIADFNNDGWVDAGDLAEWKSGYATGEYTARDFLYWQRSYRNTIQATLAVVPEPSSIAIALTLAVLWPTRMRNGTKRR